MAICWRQPLDNLWYGLIASPEWPGQLEPTGGLPCREDMITALNRAVAASWGGYDQVEATDLIDPALFAIEEVGIFDDPDEEGQAQAGSRDYASGFRVIGGGQ